LFLDFSPNSLIAVFNSLKDNKKLRKIHIGKVTFAPKLLLDSVLAVINNNKTVTTITVKFSKAHRSTLTSDDEKKVIAAIKGELDAMNQSIFKKLNSNDFEKDDDTNHHIDFIAAATNLRCVNYQIKPTTRATCRLTAGKIIPAIATTTAMITGFVGIEVLKYIKGTPLEGHRAATVNLGTNVFCVENLPDPLKKKTGLDAETYMQCTAVPEGFTTWDKIVINQPGATVGQILEMFPKIHHGAEVSCLTTVNGKIVYDSMRDKKEVLTVPLIDAIVRVEGPVSPPSRNYVVLIAAGVSDKEGNTAICPKIQFIFK